MRIKFIPPDPRAGAVAQMDSFRGQQLISSRAAVQINEDGSDIPPAVIPDAPSETSTTIAPVSSTTLVTPSTPTQKPSFGLNVEQIRAALKDRGLAIPEGLSRKADLAALLDGAGE
ncbi:hypothetical protein RBI14_15555 [Alcaligenaceae bacterium B3P038]|nr:hypothetical protein [Alcaligenaceae bacterium B3P038]